MSHPAPAGPSADRNLLFGILAVQMDFVSRDALIAAMHAWVLAKHRPLGELLEEQRALSPAQRQALDLVAAEHLKAHGDEAQRSLAAVAHHSTLGDLAQSLADPDLQASLAAAGATLATTVDTRPMEDGLRYRVVRPHAQGGLGVVSVARDAELGREVAFKEIQARFAGDNIQRGRFVREAEITGGLEHPGIVPVYGLGRYADGRPYYAMRFIRGESLQEATRKLHAGEARYTLRDLLTRFVAVCNAVAYAHSRGVIHRDLKPANVMLGPFGETLVVDWGLAKVVGRESAEDESLAEGTLRPPSGEDSLTQAGSHLGTPAFMSPEQARGEVTALGPSTDVYSLGATLYAVLTGKPPVQGRDIAEVLEKVQQGDWRPARKAKRSVPRALDAVCRKAMALQAADRYATALELAVDVEHWLADDPVSAWREPWPTRAGRWVRRHRTKVAAAVAASFVALLLGGAGLMWQQRVQALQRQEQDRRRAATEAALEKVSDFQARARWAEARTALEQAEDRLSGTTSTELQGRVEDARRNLELVTRLDAIRQKSITRFIESEAIIDPAATDRDYEAAFGSARIGVPGTDPEAVARRVEESPVREALVATLDDWARVTSGNRRAWALAVARNADPNSWRDSLRDPAAWEIPRRLAKLASEAPAEQVGPGLAAAIGDRLSAEGEGVELLRAAQALWPGDFWLNYYLASVLQRNRRYTESEGFQRAALALRPDIAATYYNLASVLENQGKKDEAYALFLKAFEFYPKPSGLKPEVVWAWGVGTFGVVWERLGKLDEAAALCRKAIQSDPGSPVGHSSLGWVLERQGKLQEAANCYQRAIETAPKDVSARFNLCKSLEHQNKWEMAVALYRKILDDNPKDATARNGLAGALRAQGKWEELIALYRKALDDNPKDADARNGLAGALQFQRKWEEVGDLYRSWLDDNPKDAAARNGLAGALRAQGKWEELIALYRKALDDNPKDAAARNGLAGALQGQSKWEEVADLYRSWLDENPKDATARNSLAGALEALGRWEEVAALYRKALDDNRKDANARNRLAAALRARGRWEEAAALYRKALDDSPKDANARNGLAGALQGQGKWEEAVDLYRKALDDNPKDAAARNGLAGALQGQGKWEEAAPLYRRALEDNPGDAFARRQLAEALNRQGKWDEAADLYRKWLKDNPKDANASGDLGWLLMSQGRSEEGAILYRKALEANPRSFLLRFNLGHLLQWQEKWNEAAEYYRKWLEENPENSAALIGLAAALRGKGRLQEAVALYRHALSTNPRETLAYNGLATALEKQGKFEDVPAVYREWLKVSPYDASAHHRYGNFLERNGKLADAAVCYHKIIELEPSWHYGQNALPRVLLALGRYTEAREAAGSILERKPPDKAVRSQAESYQRQASLGDRLPAVLRGQDRPSNATQGLDFAELCWLQGHYSDAVHLTADALATDPKLANDLTNYYRYKAACHAASAGCQMGHGTAKLSEEARARMRAQALKWLRADLNECRDLARTRAHWSEAMNHLSWWHENDDLSGVRDLIGLARLPEAERKEWEAFWADVKAILANPPTK
jgi:tetratricopeptide (TPR) repeat protein